MNGGGTLSRGALYQAFNSGRFSFGWLQTNSSGVADGQILAGNTVVEANKWYHVAIVRDSTALTVKLFVNGVLDGVSSYGGSLPGYRFYWLQTLGDRRQSLTGALGGSLDEVAFFTRALTDAESRPARQR